MRYLFKLIWIMAKVVWASLPPGFGTHVVVLTGHIVHGAHLLHGSLGNPLGWLAGSAGADAVWHLITVGLLLHALWEAVHLARHAWHSLRGRRDALQRLLRWWHRRGKEPDGR